MPLCVSYVVAERHIFLDFSPTLVVHLVCHKAKKQVFAVTWEAFGESKVVTKGHIFLNQQLCVFLEPFSLRFTSSSSLPISQSLSLPFPLLNDLFGLTQMTHLVWRNIPVTWLAAFQHLLLRIKSTQQEVAGVAYKNAYLNTAQTQTGISSVSM